jgi:hypothetical protein
MKHCVFGIKAHCSTAAITASRSSAGQEVENVANESDESDENDENDDDYVYKKDVVGRALFFAHDHLLNNHHFRYSSDRQELEYAKASDFDDIEPRQQGFARRPEQGKFYGAKYGTPYVSRVKEMFDEGTKASSSKFSASQMQEVLRHENRDHPFCIPTLHEITTLIQTFMRKGDSADPNNDETAIAEEAGIATSTYSGKIPLPIFELLFAAMQ